MSRQRSTRAGLSDTATVALACAAWLGASIGVPVPRVLGVGAVAAGWASRRAAALCLGVFVLAGAVSHAAITPTEPISAGTIDGVVTVRTDPVRISRGTRLDGELLGRRYELIAFGPASARLRDRLVGERIAIAGSVRPARHDSFGGRRGVVGTISVTEVRGHTAASGHERLANEFRHRLTTGSTSLHFDDQALFLGIVFGDDRNLSLLVEDDFRAAGLTHLVAVSGQNVAFVLIVFGPLLRRVNPSTRLLLVVAVLLFFGTITRFEPSVVRATAMAAIAATAAALGREAAATRTLSLAIAGLLLFDPRLVHSLGFRLSVAATAGILWLAPPIARWLPGPRVLREALGVTIGAQFAVAPMLTATFGGIPAASIPANVLAGPVSAPVMIWGLTGGVVAGFMPHGVAEVMHRPTGWLTGWLRLIARAASEAPLGMLGPVEVFGGAVLVVLLLVAGYRRIAGLAALVILVLPSLFFVAPIGGRFELGPDLVAWRGDVSVIELGPLVSPTRVLSRLRTAGIADIHLVVLRENSDAERAAAATIEARHRVGTMWSTDDVRPGAQVEFGTVVVVHRMPEDPDPDSDEPVTGSLIVVAAPSR